MNVEKLIKDVKKRNTIIKLKQDELLRLKTLCEVSGISFEGDKVTGSRDTEAKSKAYNKYITFKDKLHEYIVETIVIREELTEIICMLEKPLNIKVMSEYCLEDKSFKKVANEIGYSKSRIIDIYNESLCEMKEKTYEI